MKALILNEKVVQVAEQDFPVAPPMYWVYCGGDVKGGWAYVGGAFQPPTGKDLGETRAEALGEIKRQLQSQLRLASTPGKEEIYRYKENERLAWETDLSPRDLASYPFAVAETAALLSVSEASVVEADVDTTIATWRQATNSWTDFAVKVEKEYVRAITGIENATTVAQIEAVKAMWPPAPVKIWRA